MMAFPAQERCRCRKRFTRYALKALFRPTIFCLQFFCQAGLGAPKIQSQQLHKLLDGYWFAKQITLVQLATILG